MKDFLTKLALGEYLSGWKTLTGTALLALPYFNQRFDLNISKDLLDAVYSLGVEFAALVLAIYGLWGKAVSIWKSIK